MRISGRLKLEEVPNERADKWTGVRICVPSGSVDKSIKVRSATELKEVHIDTHVVTGERGEVELIKNCKKRRLQKSMTCVDQTFVLGAAPFCLRQTLKCRAGKKTCDLKNAA